MSGSDALPLPILAYLGLGSGVELLPYFVALLSFAGAALLAIVQRPLILVLRRLHKPRDAPGDAPPKT